MNDQAKQNFLARYGSAKHLDSVMDNHNTDMYNAMGNPFFNHTHIQKLIDSGHGGIRDAITHPEFFDKATPEQVDHLAKDKSTATTLSGKIHSLQPHHIESLLNVFEKHYNYSLATNLGRAKNATPEQLHRMAHIDDPHMNQSLANNKRLPEEYIPRFINSSIVLNRCYVADHPKLQSKHMETLSNDENQFVRATLAKRKDLPIHIIHKLAEDESPSVRSEIFTHHSGK